MKKLLLILWLALAAIPCNAAICDTKVSAVNAAQISASVSINSTGTNAVWAVVSDYAGGATLATVSVSDNKANSYSRLIGNSSKSTINTRITVWYAENITAGASHTITYNSSGTNTFATLLVMACSGVKTSSSFDQENGATTVGATTIQTGSVTPSEDNEIVITGVSTLSLSSLTMTGYTVEVQAAYNAGNSIGGGLAYKVQTSAGAENPTWALTTSVEASAGITTFKASGGSPSPCAHGRFGVAGVGGCN